MKLTNLLLALGFVILFSGSGIVQAQGYTGNCTQFPPVGAPAGYVWRADCNYSCETNASCKADFESKSGYVYKDTSYWCYGFNENSEIKPKCMQLLYTKEDKVEEDKNAIAQLMEIIFPDDLLSTETLLLRLTQIATRLTTPGADTTYNDPNTGGNPSGGSSTAGDPEGVYSGDLPTNNHATYGLSNPSENQVKSFYDQVKSNPLRTWAKDCLYNEKVLTKRGEKLNPYLLCAWVWFEGALDPYAVNCKDNTSAEMRQSVAQECSAAASRSGDKNSLVQIGGYQGFDQAASNKYNYYFDKCYPSADDAKLRSLLQNTFDNSKNTTNSYWSYTAQSGKGMVQTYAPGIGSAQRSDIATSKTELDLLGNNDIAGERATQFYTFLLGKDPCLRVGLNISATNPLPDDIRTKGWAAYVRSNESNLSARLEALRILDRDLKAEYQTSGDSGGDNSDGSETGTPNTGSTTGQGCPNASQSITAPNSEVKLLNRRDQCIKPTMIVIHWTVGWITPETTLSVLNERELSCQFLTGTTNGQTKQLQSLFLFPSVVERAACVKRYPNAISFELSGDSFDKIYNNPSHEKYKELMGSDGKSGSTGRAVQTVCWLLKQYNIPKNQVFGHLELNPEDKVDPGAQYIKYFRQRVATDCN